MTLRLLVADDSVTIQKIVTLAFSGEDAVIESASDGNSALESARSFKPDIILADIFMPGCSGYDVCARIKDDPLLSETPVILLVGTFEPYDEKEASRVKSDACLTKPFDTSELIRTVRTLVQRRETKQGNQNPQKLTVPPKPRLRHAGKKKLVSPAAWESFLGEKRVLDVFDTEA